MIQAYSIKIRVCMSGKHTENWNISFDIHTKTRRYT